MDKRLKILKIIIAVIFILLIARAGQLQIVLGDYYYELSEGNRTSLRPIHAPRGKIIDRNGKILVSNKLSYNLYLLPNEIPPDLTVETLFQRLVELTEIKLDKLKENYKQYYEQGSRLSAIILERNIKPETMVIVEENSNDLPGILVKESSIRDYVFNDLAAHILGYVGEIGINDLRRFNSQGYNYSSRDIVGVTGLEREYETYLKGTDGIEQIEVNSVGNKVKTLGTKAPRPGNSLILNLDSDLQKKAEELLKEHFVDLREKAKADPELDLPTGAAAIVMDPNTGKVLSMVSIPTFDLNNFAEGFSDKSYHELINDPLNPLLNRPLMAVVPPGSIFKLVTGTAAIENLGVTGDSTFIDRNGKFYIPNWSKPYKNWHKGGEGELDFTRAIARSNNIVFYKLGYRLYKKYYGKKLIECARHYGLGSKTGIDLPGEKSGLVPDREWKQEKLGEGWYPGDSVNLSIGQGGLLTTPIQLIEIISAIANKGIMYKPYLVDKIISPEGKLVKDFKPEIRLHLDFDRDVFNILQQGMTEVTTSSYGTARSIFRDFPVKVAGKTGTAQTGFQGSNHGWFAGFAPVEKPEIAVLVFLENGNSSSYTLPIAAGIMKYYFGLNNNKTTNKYSSILLKENYFRTTNRLFDFFEEVFSNQD